MTIYHSNLRKRKKSGGRKRPYRGRRRFEFGGTEAKTVVGDPKIVKIKARGGNYKIKLLSGRNVNLNDVSGRTVKTEILSVLDNPAGVDLKRRGIITKGTTIQTPLGKARVTSSPGQNGVINAVLIK
ncbi:MAG: 30S ribosomal protein S8e [Thermoproteota archaeon]